MFVFYLFIKQKTDYVEKNVLNNNFTFVNMFIKNI